MSKQTKQDRRPKSTVSNAVHVAKLATGEIEGYKDKPKPIKCAKKGKKDRSN